MNFSKGEYIGFVDSDDYIDEKYYEELYNTAKKYDSDMVSTPNMGITKNKDLYDYEQNFDIGNILHLYGYYKMHSYRCGIFNWSSCNRLLKRCFIINNNILFPISSISEDYCFILEILAYNPKLSVNEKAIYHYILNNEYKKRFDENQWINFCVLFNRTFNIYLQNSIENIGYAMDRILIILFDDYCKISKSDRVKVYNFLKPELQSIISNNKNIMPSNYLLRCFYKYIISDTNYKYKADRLIF